MVTEVKRTRFVSLVGLVSLASVSASGALRQAPADLIVMGGAIYTADARRPRVDAFAVPRRPLRRRRLARRRARDERAPRPASSISPATPSCRACRTPTAIFWALAPASPRSILRDTTEPGEHHGESGGARGQPGARPLDRGPRLGSERLAGERLAHAAGTLTRSLPTRRWCLEAHRRTRAVGQQQGAGAGRRHRGDQRSRGRPAVARRRRSAHWRLHRHRADGWSNGMFRQPTAGRDRRADPRRRSRDAATGPDDGARCGRVEPHHRGLPPAERRGTSRHATLRDDRLAARRPQRNGSRAARWWIPQHRVTVRAVKLYADGALGSRGALLLEDYADEPGTRGLLVTPPDGWPPRPRPPCARDFSPARTPSATAPTARCSICTNGSKATADRRATCGPASSTRRFSIGPTSRASAGLASSRRCSRRIARRTCHGRRPVWAAARVAEGAYVWQTLLKSGARLASGSDFPVEQANPLLGFYAAITRQDIARAAARGLGARRAADARRRRWPASRSTRPMRHTPKRRSGRSRPASSPTSSCCPAIS